MRFLLLCKSRVEFCFAFLELENYFFKFSCLAGWQNIKKCVAIIWNSVIQFQHSMTFVVQVTKFSWADEAARQILFQAMLAWNFALEFQNSNAICFNFLGAPDGRRMTNPKQLSGIPLWNSNIRFLLLCKSRNFSKLTKLHAEYNCKQCLFGILSCIS